PKTTNSSSNYQQNQPSSLQTYQNPSKHHQHQNVFHPDHSQENRGHRQRYRRFASCKGSKAHQASSSRPKSEGCCFRCLWRGTVHHQGGVQDGEVL
ncbi:hypothetical protein CC86DRAFT_466933, partial [Ophiobolus disseminans]